MAIREQLKSFKKERILEQAQRLFYERGFRGTSLEAIADAMGMTKPFVYGVYDKKTDILYDIALQITSLSLEVAENAARAEGTPSQRLTQMAEGLAKVCMEHQIGTAVFFREEAQLEPERLAYIHELKGRFDEVLAGVLQEGVDSGEFRIDDVRLAALAIGGMICWTYSWYRQAGRLSQPEICERLGGYALRLAGVPQSD